MEKSASEFLRLIAEGYYRRCEHDRYVIIDNPDFQEDNGSDPFLVWDIEGGGRYQ